MRTEIHLKCFLLAALFFVVPLAAASSGPVDDKMRVVHNSYPGEATYHQGDVDFVRQLDDALDHDRVDWVADHMYFPLAFFGKSGVVIDVNNKNDLKKNFQIVFDKKLRSLIKRTAKTGEMTFIGGYGMMLGRGNMFFFSPITNVNDGTKAYTIWEIQQCGRMKILRC